MENENKTLGKFYQNPYYDDVFGIIQHDFPIPTKQSRNKENIKEFKKRVVYLLNRDMKSAWPRTGRLLISLAICCPQNYISKVDVDNFLKLLFDIFKGYVFKDDSQVYYVTASKSIHPLDMIGFMAGVRELKEEEYPDFDWPSLFSNNEQDWREERLSKFGEPNP